VAELAIAGLSGGAPSVPLGATPSRFPPVDRDLAIVVAATTPAGAVAASIRRHGGDALDRITLFDVYQGRPLADDERSLAYRLTFHAGADGLADEVVDSAMAAITAGVSTDVGGRVRT
jgi:phenylalanyl-tRNA synthetase beta chain